MAHAISEGAFDTVGATELVPCHAYGLWVLPRASHHVQGLTVHMGCFSTFSETHTHTCCVDLRMRDTPPQTGLTRDLQA